MVHKNARAGFNKLFIVQVIGIIAALSSLLIFLPDVGDKIASSIITIVMLVASIIQLIGLSQAAKDEDLFAKAFSLSVISLVLVVVEPIMNQIFPSATWISSAFDLVDSVIGLFIIRNILYGGAKLNSDLEGKAKGTWRFLVVIIVIEIVSTIGLMTFNFFGDSEVGEIIGFVTMGLVFIGIILDVIQYFMMLSFYGKARKIV